MKSGSIVVFCITLDLINKGRMVEHRLPDTYMQENRDLR